MKRIVTNRQMKELDEYTIQKIGVASLILMERAALSVFEVLEGEKFNLSNILVICGTGNNGGDGIAIARLLHLAGYRVAVYLTGNTGKSSEEHRRQVKIAENYGTTFVNNPNLPEYTTIVDSVFGIGLSRGLPKTYCELFQAINNTDADVLAVDIPSGVHGDSGCIMGAAIRAEVTVTFAFAKPGLLLYPGKGYSGRVIVKDIGIYENTFCKEPFIWQLEAGDRNIIPARADYSNKGSFGKVFIIAGSHNMSGAAYLCAKACFRTGAGMVKLHTVASNREILQKQLPEAMLSTYEENANFPEIEQGIKWADIIGIGPGIGTGEAALKMIFYILSNTMKPLVIDADGLNLLNGHMERLKNYEGPCIVTPHLGEMSRMTGREIPWIRENLLEAATGFAKKYGTICVLKDARTVTALPDGQVFINATGNNGMATAGSGDTLTGILLGLLAQHTDISMAAPLSVYLHGMTGDLARNRLGARAMMASDR